MVTHVSLARAGRWKEAAWKSPPARSGIGYVARRARTAGLRDGNYDSQLPDMGTPLRMRMGGADRLLYKRGAEGLETAVGSWQVERQVGRGSWGEEAEELPSEGGGGREEKRRRRWRSEQSRASSQGGDEFVCPQLRLRPGLGNWELGLERHPWKWEEVALGL